MVPWLQLVGLDRQAWFEKAGRDRPAWAEMVEGFGSEVPALIESYPAPPPNVKVFIDGVRKEREVELRASVRPLRAVRTGPVRKALVMRLTDRHFFGASHTMGMRRAKRHFFFVTFVPRRKRRHPGDLSIG